MNKKLFAFIGVISLVAAIAVSHASAAMWPSFPDSSFTAQKRVLAQTHEQLDEALAKGCRLIRQVKDMGALTCPESVASAMGLPEDLRVYALDSVANNQIHANVVQSAGNTGTGRTVAILDTGYDYTHPDLSSSYMGGKDFVNGDNDPMDDNGHGTHVAGIITADGVNPSAKGAAPSVGIISGKVLDSYGSGYFSDVVAGIYWAVDGLDGIAGTADDFNVDAINLSLGTGAPYLYRGFCDSVMPTMTNAIKYANSKGVNVVVAAGNTSWGVSLPGCISYAVTVGAVDDVDRIASFSGRGSAVDLTAPGVTILSSVPGGGYESWNGTSMATPAVSAVIALIKAAHPTYTPIQVQNALFTTAKDLGRFGKDTSYGWGRVDAAAAVK